MAITLTKDQILKDIQDLYQQALEDKKWQVALHAKEIQGKILGHFQRQDLPKVVPIAEMSDEQIHEYIKRLRRVDPDLRTIESPHIEVS
jgi:hypothetical protein